MHVHQIYNIAGAVGIHQIIIDNFFFSKKKIYNIAGAVGIFRSISVFGGLLLLLLLLLLFIFIFIFIFFVWSHN